MNHPLKVLVAVDLADRAHELVRDAISWLEGRPHLEIDLVYAFELTPAVGMVYEPLLWHELVPQWERPFQQAREALADLLAQVPEAARGHALIPMGAPAPVICDMTARYDLVVVGTRQRRGLPRMWLGSHAERIVRASAVPVLVIPFPSDRRD